jgi:hypothetical protein
MSVSALLPDNSLKPAHTRTPSGLLPSPARDLFPLTRLLCAYQEAAQQADEAADQLFTVSLQLERDIQTGKAQSLRGVPLYRHPHITHARIRLLSTAEAEERAYFAWLLAVNQFARLDWAERLEILEVDGWYWGIKRLGASYELLYHRDETPVRYASRLEGVLWMHGIIADHVRHAQGSKPRHDEHPPPASSATPLEGHEPSQR